MTPIALSTAVPLTSAMVTSGVTDFFGIGAVLAIVAIMLAFPIIRRAVGTLRGLGGRG